MITKFDKGPKVRVHVTMRRGQICSSSLELSDTFSCIGADVSTIEWLKLYLEGKAPPLNLLFGTPFQKEAMEQMSQIPFGKTCSYKDLAIACGNPNAARAIGNAANKNPYPLFIPCHRIISSDGKIGGFAMDLEIKKRLLEYEAGVPCPII